MKFWFTKKTPKELYDGKAPYDATVEQVLRVAQEVSTAPVESERETFDFAQAFRTKSEPPPPVAAKPLDAKPLDALAPLPALKTPKVSRAMREEMQRRVTNYHAFQTKLNDEREARIRQTMDELRAKLKQSAVQIPPTQ